MPPGRIQVPVPSLIIAALHHNNYYNGLLTEHRVAVPKSTILVIVIKKEISTGKQVFSLSAQVLQICVLNLSRKIG